MSTTRPFCNTPGYVTADDCVRLEVARCELTLPHAGPHTFHAPDGSVYEWEGRTPAEQADEVTKWATIVRPAAPPRLAVVDDARWLEVVCSHPECGGVVRCIGNVDHAEVEHQAAKLAELHRAQHERSAWVAGSQLDHATAWWLRVRQVGLNQANAEFPEEAESFVVGDRDTTPALDHVQCEATGPGDFPSICTRYSGHDGPHASGNGFVIVNVWLDEEVAR